MNRKYKDYIHNGCMVEKLLFVLLLLVCIIFVGCGGDGLRSEKIKFRHVRMELPLGWEALKNGMFSKGDGFKGSISNVRLKGISFEPYIQLVIDGEEKHVRTYSHKDFKIGHRALKIDELDAFELLSKYPKDDGRYGSATLDLYIKRNRDEAVLISVTTPLKRISHEINDFKKIYETIKVRRSNQYD